MMNNERMSYWMAPNEEFLESTGCYRTGRVETFHMMPRSEWSCKNEYPGLPLDPVYNYVRWWERPTLTSQPQPTHPVVGQFPAYEGKAELVAVERSTIPKETATPNYRLWGGIGLLAGVAWYLFKGVLVVR